MGEFTVGANRYRAGKMSAITQLQVGRRLLAVIPGVMEALKSGAISRIAALADDAKVKRHADGDDKAIPASDNPLLSDGMLDAIGSLQPVFDALARISDDDVDYVVGHCLGACQREEAGGRGWAPIWSAEAKRPMFEDIGSAETLQICFFVLKDNILPFTNAAA